MRPLFVCLVRDMHNDIRGVSLWAPDRSRVPQHFLFSSLSLQDEARTRKEARDAYRTTVREGYAPVFEKTTDLGDLLTELEVSWPRVHHDLQVLSFLYAPYMRRDLTLEALAVEVLREGVEVCPAPHYGDKPKDISPRAMRRMRLVRRVLSHLLPALDDAALRQAYIRERRLSRILREVTHHGLPLRYKAVQREHIMATKWLVSSTGSAEERWLRAKRGELHDSFIRHALDRSLWRSNFAQNGTPTGRITTLPDLTALLEQTKLPLVPHVKEFIGSSDEYLCIRQYCHLEAHVAAHHAQGSLSLLFGKYPEADVYEAICKSLATDDTSVWTRREVKSVMIGFFHGTGPIELSLQLDCPVERVRRLRNALLRSVPELRKLDEDLSAKATRGEPIRTCGGRRYRFGANATGLMPLLIQGSAADCVKQAVVNYYNAGSHAKWPLVMVTRDELVVVAKEPKAAQNALRAAMEGVELSVPMKTDGYQSRVSWYTAGRSYGKEG